MDAHARNQREQLLAGTVTDPDRKRAGHAMGLNVFALFRSERSGGGGASPAVFEPAGGAV